MKKSALTLMCLATLLSGCTTTTSSSAPDMSSGEQTSDVSSVSSDSTVSSVLTSSSEQGRISTSSTNPATNKFNVYKVFDLQRDGFYYPYFKLNLKEFGNDYVLEIPLEGQTNSGKLLANGKVITTNWVYKLYLSDINKDGYRDLIYMVTEEEAVIIYDLHNSKELKRFEYDESEGEYYPDIYVDDDKIGVVYENRMKKNDLHNHDIYYGVIYYDPFTNSVEMGKSLLPKVKQINTTFYNLDNYKTKAKNYSDKANADYLADPEVNKIIAVDFEIVFDVSNQENFKVPNIDFQNFHQSENCYSYNGVLEDGRTYEYTFNFANSAREDVNPDLGMAGPQADAYNYFDEARYEYKYLTRNDEYLKPDEFSKVSSLFGVTFADVTQVNYSESASKDIDVGIIPLARQSFKDNRTMAFLEMLLDDYAVEYNPKNINKDVMFDVTLDLTTSSGKKEVKYQVTPQGYIKFNNKWYSVGGDARLQTGSCYAIEK